MVGIIMGPSPEPLPPAPPVINWRPPEVIEHGGFAAVPKLKG